MAEHTGWSDVKLLEFDLRTIRFEYSPVESTLQMTILFANECVQGYGLMITCCNSSAMQPTYNLKFFINEATGLRAHVGEQFGTQPQNPHKTIATWAAKVLSGKSLSRNVRLLVHCLRFS